MSNKDYLTIGEVVARLRSAHPDLSVSKLRFLEDEGLISPERTPSGYRKFSKSDVSRLEMVLKMQKEYFYPLAIIKEKLAEVDQGVVPKELQPKDGENAGVQPQTHSQGAVLLKESLATIGVPESFITELDSFGLATVFAAPGGSYIENGDVSAVKAAWELRKYGIEPRNLRMYATFSDKESALYEQILMPTFRHKTPESRRKLNEALVDIASLSDRLKGRLLRKSLNNKLKDLL